jgi:hypothetical protein
LANTLFVLFALLFISSRLIVYPATVIYHGWHYGPRYYPSGEKDVWLMPSVMVALGCLYAMHAYWSYLVRLTTFETNLKIVKMIFDALSEGRIKGDVRDLDHED